MSSVSITGLKGYVSLQIYITPFFKLAVNPTHNHRKYPTYKWGLMHEHVTIILYRCLLEHAFLALQVSVTSSNEQLERDGPGCVVPSQGPMKRDTSLTIFWSVLEAWVQKLK